MAKYFSPQEINRIVAETEAELDSREAQRAEQQRMQQITAWINDPRNKATIDADPMVQKLRAMGNPVPQRPTAGRPAQPGTLPAVINGNQRFHPSHMKLRHTTPQIDAVGDPKVHSPSGKPKSSPVPVRYGPGGPAIPPNGFWVV